MELADLKKEIPYKWRVQSFSKFKPEATCVAYIDARDAMELLDSVIGPENWQDDYKIVGNQLIAGIGIKCFDDWVWKWDTGTESNIEKEKGQMSDAFKRACVKWGIGRFLYSLKIHRVAANEKKAGGNYPYPIDANNKRIWDLTEHINGNQPKKQSPGKTAKEIVDDLGRSKNIDMLADVWGKNLAEINLLNEKDLQYVVKNKDGIKGAFEAEIEHDKAKNES